MLKQKFILSVAVFATFISGMVANTFAIGVKGKRSATFKVRIENISDKGGLTAKDGSKYPFAVSPGFYVASDADVGLFKVGKKASPALRSLAEEGDPTLLTGFISSQSFTGHSGIFNQPVGATMAAPILPDGAFEFTFDATQGMKLNLTAMFGQSNDLFYAPSTPIELFDKSGNPVTGDVTGTFQLWDAGTEVNEAPGIGPDQAPRQKMKGQGTPEKSVVHLVKDGFSYPNTKDVLHITITAQ